MKRFCRVGLLTILLSPAALAAPRVFPPQPPACDPIADSKAAQVLATEPKEYVNPLIWARLGHLDEALKAARSMPAHQLEPRRLADLIQEIYMTVARRRVLLGDTAGATDLLPRITEPYDRVDAAILLARHELKAQRIPEAKNWINKACDWLFERDGKNKSSINFTDYMAAVQEIVPVLWEVGEKNKVRNLTRGTQMFFSKYWTDAAILDPKSPVRKAVVEYGMASNIGDLLVDNRPDVALKLATLKSNLGANYDIYRLSVIADYYLERRQWKQAGSIVLSMQQRLSKMDALKKQDSSFDNWYESYVLVAGAFQTLGDKTSAQKWIQRLNQKAGTRGNSTYALQVTIAPLLVLEGRQLEMPIGNPPRKPRLPLTNAQRGAIAGNINALLKQKHDLSMRFQILGVLFCSQVSAGELDNARKTLIQLQNSLGPETSFRGSLGDYGYPQRIAGAWLQLGDEQRARAIISSLLHQGEDVGPFGFVEEDARYNLSLPAKERSNNFPHFLARNAATFRTSSEVPRWILQLSPADRYDALAFYIETLTQGYFEKSEWHFLKRERH